MLRDATVFRIKFTIHMVFILWHTCLKLGIYNVSVWYLTSYKMCCIWMNDSFPNLIWTFLGVFSTAACWFPDMWMFLYPAGITLWSYSSWFESSVLVYISACEVTVEVLISIRSSKSCFYISCFWRLSVSQRLTGIGECFLSVFWQINHKQNGKWRKNRSLMKLN